MTLKNRNLAILIGSLAIMLAIVYGYWNFVYQPLKASIAVERKTVSDLNSKLSTARARAGQLNKIQAEMQTLQIDVAQLERQLPKGAELPALLRVFTHRAEAYGLSMTSFAPQRTVGKGLYDEIPYMVTLSSTFHNLGHFLTAMGKGDRLFAARNLALQSAASKTDPAKTVNATFTLIAFKYHE
jgi:type IV pilus assembly protein PilO